MRVASGIFGVAVAAFLVTLCPDILCMPHEDRQMTALPVCPPDNGEVILFPKPENCSEFYQCAGGVAFTHHCQVNLYYCEEKQYCTWPEDPDCTFNCVITKTNPVPAAEEIVSIADPICPPQNDDDEIIFIPNPNNCSAYYECDNGVLTPMGCPEYLYFCSQKNICSWDWDPECKYDCVAVLSEPVIVEEKIVSAADPVCPPQIDDEIIFIPNPNNCSAFYECDNGLPAPMGCPEYLYFCSQKNICSWTWDPDCKYDCVAVLSEPVIVEEKRVSL